MIEGNEEVVNTSVSAEYKDVYDKYKGDVNQILKGYKEMQQRVSSVEKASKPPKEYSAPESFKELDNSVQEKVMDVAKRGEYTQKAFEVLVSETVNSRHAQESKAQENQRLREAALGGEYEADKLKSYFQDKMPEKLLDKILTKGTADEIHELKRQREQGLGSKVSEPAGANSAPTDTRSHEKQIVELRKELRDLAKERHTSDAKTVEVIKGREMEIATELGKLQEIVQKGFGS